MNIFCMFKEYIPAARETIACTDLPNGKAFYEQVSLGSFELFLTITLHLFICKISYLEHCGLCTMYMFSGKDYANVTCIFCLMELINNRKTKTNKQKLATEPARTKEAVKDKSTNSKTRKKERKRVKPASNKQTNKQIV